MSGDIATSLDAFLRRGYSLTIGPRFEEGEYVGLAALVWCHGEGEMLECAVTEDHDAADLLDYVESELLEMSADRAISAIRREAGVKELQPGFGEALQSEVQEDR